MRKIGILPIIILACSLLASCGGRKIQTSEETPEERIIFAMDTAVTLTAYGENAEKAVMEAENEINRLDTLMSRLNEDGDVYPLNNSGAGTVDDETALVLNTAVEIGKSTNGAFDITIAPVMDLWGFFGHNYRIPDDAEIEAQLEKVDYNNIEIQGNNISLKSGASVDLGGIAKGYASEMVKEIFLNNGIKSGLISFGSAIQAVGTRNDGSAWRVGIADPQNSEENIARLELTDKCIATSGSYEQAFEENGRKYHHIIDPSTGYPSESGLASVSVINDDATTADGLSTALFVMGLDEAIEYWKTNRGFEAVFITDSNAVYYTSGLAGSFDMTNGAEYTMIE